MNAAKLMARSCSCWIASSRVEAICVDAAVADWRALSLSLFMTTRAPRNDAKTPAKTIGTTNVSHRRLRARADRNSRSGRGGDL